MLQIEQEMVKYLREKELKLYLQSLSEGNEKEISHWQKVARSRERGL